MVVAIVVLSIIVILLIIALIISIIYGIRQRNKLKASNKQLKYYNMSSRYSHFD